MYRTRFEHKATDMFMALLDLTTVIKLSAEDLLLPDLTFIPPSCEPSVTCHHIPTHWTFVVDWKVCAGFQSQGGLSRVMAIYKEQLDFQVPELMTGTKLKIPQNQQDSVLLSGDFLRCLSSLSMLSVVGCGRCLQNQGGLLKNYPTELHINRTLIWKWYLLPMSQE